MSYLMNIGLVSLASVLLFSIGCSDASQDSPSADGRTAASSAAADAAGLEALFARLQGAIRANDVATAAQITRGLLPDEASLQKAVKDPDAIDKIEEMYAPFATASDDRIAGLFAVDENRTEIKVHSATTEELAAYERGTTAFAEFPGGARAAAETVLQPHVTFYEVELVEPGKSRGTKFHLFYHDGEHWKMLGKVWRALR